MVRENKFITDIRVNVILAIISSIAILIYKKEITFTIAFTVSIVFILFQGQYRKALNFASAFVILFILSILKAGKSGLATLWLFATIARHLLIPLSFLQGILERSIGELLEVCHRLHLPKSFGVSAIVLMRFFPTIKYELNTIRGALKFRGIGISLFSTLFHLPKNFYLTLIPLLIRTVRISDEITTAALTRGIDLDRDIVSFSEVKWTNKNTVFLVVFSVLISSLKIIEIKWGWQF